MGGLSLGKNLTTHFMSHQLVGLPGVEPGSDAYKAPALTIELQAADWSGWEDLNLRSVLPRDSD